MFSAKLPERVGIEKHGSVLGARVHVLVRMRVRVRVCV